MLKASYFPRWTATVDGEPTTPRMLAPGFVGVPVPAGSHLVVFKFRSSTSYPAYFVIGALTLVALIVGPRVLRRRRRVRPDAGSEAVTTAPG